MGSARNRLEASLPVHAEGLTLRLLNRADMDALARWPAYPWPHDVFRFSFRDLKPEEMDRAYDERNGDPNRITLVVDTSDTPAVGYIALIPIEWPTGWAENMAFRIHPASCDRGIGTRSLVLVCDWWFAQGMKGLRLDVAATNHRAVRCYEKAGFKKTGEFWRDAPDLAGKDLREATYSFLENHVDCSSDSPRVRFYWMEAMF